MLTLPFPPSASHDNVLPYRNTGNWHTPESSEDRLHRTTSMCDWLAPPRSGDYWPGPKHGEGVVGGLCGVLGSVFGDCVGTSQEFDEDAWLGRTTISSIKHPSKDTAGEDCFWDKLKGFFSREPKRKVAFNDVPEVSANAVKFSLRCCVAFLSLYCKTFVSLSAKKWNHSTH